MVCSITAYIHWMTGNVVMEKDKMEFTWNLSHVHPEVLKTGSARLLCVLYAFISEVHLML